MRYKKTVLWLLGVAVFLLLIHFGLNFWIKTQLPKIINRENDSPYYITYKDIDVSLYSGNIVAKNILLVPKAALKDTITKAGIYARVESIEVTKFKVLDLVFTNKIRAKSITVNKPQVTLYQKNDKAINDSKSLRSQVSEPFLKVIVVSDVFLNHGHLKILNVSNNLPILDVANINLQLDGIVITDDILERKIPFGFDSYRFSYDSLYYRPSEFYHIRTKALQTTNKSLTVSQFEMLPEYSRAEFVKRIPKEKDIYTTKVATISIANIDWGFQKKAFYCHAGKVTLDEANANIYRGKMPEDDLSKKYLYNKLLRDLDFDLQVDTLAVRNSTLEYEEEKTFEKGAGMLSFTKFNLTARHISSGFQKKKVPDVDIAVNCIFMKASPLKVRWKLNVLDQTDGFNIRGSILHFPAESMTPFIKPYMNVTAKGMLDEVYFNFTGNDKVSKGDFAINYDDLKFTIYKKDNRKKKNKFLTAVARIFVKKDTKEKVKNTEIDIERIPEKSFYNFLWRSIAEGLKKLLI